MADAALASWLGWLETLHPSEIELGLERVGVVAERLAAVRPAARVLTVGGTNGKGSVAGFAEQVLLAQGRRVGLYTSPHISEFHERIGVDGACVTDGAIVAALERVESARGSTPLTFFEFTTLAALEVFARSGVEVAVLEVGMGGRLDATNVVDPDVAVVTSVGLDHAEWLGPDRDTIGAEKAGIARPGRPLIVGDRAPPTGLLEAALGKGALLEVLGRDFEWREAGSGWYLEVSAGAFEELPALAVAAPYQRDNAAMAIAALSHLGEVPGAAPVRTGLERLRLPGRFEVWPGAVEIVLDVAHNPAAAGQLARALAARPAAGAAYLVLAMYRDKDIDGVAAALAGTVQRCYPAGLAEARGAAPAAVRQACEAAGLACGAPSAEPATALAQARAQASPGDRVVVAGSFATVAAARDTLMSPPG